MPSLQIYDYPNTADKHIQYDNEVYIPQNYWKPHSLFHAMFLKMPPKTGPCSCADNDAVTNSKAINIKLVIVFIRSSVFII